MTDQSFVFTSLYKIAVNTTGDPGEHKITKELPIECIQFIQYTYILDSNECSKLRL